MSDSVGAKSVLTGDRVQLRPIRADDAEQLRVIRGSPEVRRWWGPQTVRWPFELDGSETRAIWVGGEVVGFVQWYEHPDPEYRHAGLDLFLAVTHHGLGLGRETVTLVVQHLVREGHHRIVIDPAADNAKAIACYASCGFREVGTMRRYERDVDGTGWHDGLLMEYVLEAPPDTLAT